MNIVNPPDLIKAMTPPYGSDRLEDGWPKISDNILEHMKNVSTEQA